MFLSLQRLALLVLIRVKVDLTSLNGSMITSSKVRTQVRSFG